MTNVIHLTYVDRVSINNLVNRGWEDNMGLSIMFAKLYRIAKPRPMWQVYWEDPVVLKGGRPSKHRRHFALSREEDARKFQKSLSKKVAAEGTAGLHFDAILRADAIAARQHLDVHGHMDMRLLSLAERYTSQVKTGNATSRPIGPLVEAFLHDKEFVEERTPLTVRNLKNRVWRWIDLANIVTLADITRENVECLRKQSLDATTRRNDMNAVSSFCSWLVDGRHMDYHPLARVKRPEIKHKKKPTFSNEETERLLTAAPDFGCLAPLATMVFAGPRPSELTETRFIYSRHPLVRIEGGKLRGRANRTIPMIPALRAFLSAAGNPPAPGELKRAAREEACAAANVKWAPDICRHTFISNRLVLVQNDAQVAREGGTSEGVIYRHYHALKLPSEARKWARIRPGKTPPGSTDE